MIDAASGEVLAEDHRQASRKEEVLSRVDQAGSELRKRLGESLASIHRFDQPLPEATTRSLEALRAFALGDADHFGAYEIEAIGLYKRALELDPNFALAWARLASVYRNLGDQADAEDAARHAYALKDRVSERERLYILAKSSDLTKKRTALELYRSTYPRDPTPYVNLSELETDQQAEKDLLDALRLDPGASVAYGDLAEIYALPDATTSVSNTRSEFSQFRRSIATYFVWRRRPVSGHDRAVAFAVRRCFPRSTGELDMQAKLSRFHRGEYCEKQSSNHRRATRGCFRSCSGWNCGLVQAC